MYCSLNETSRFVLLLLLEEGEEQSHKNEFIWIKWPHHGQEATQACFTGRYRACAQENKAESVHLRVVYARKRVVSTLQCSKFSGILNSLPLILFACHFFVLMALLYYMLRSCFNGGTRCHVQRRLDGMMHCFWWWHDASTTKQHTNTTACSPFDWFDQKMSCHVSRPSGVKTPSVKLSLFLVLNVCALLLFRYKRWGMVAHETCSTSSSLVVYHLR